MLLHVNFIAQRLGDRRKAERIWRWGTLVIGVVLFLIVGLFVGLNVRIRGLQQEIAKVEQERAQYQDQVKQVQDLQARQAALQPRLEVLQQVHGQNRGWHTLLTEVRRLLPESLWLTRLALLPPAKGKEKAQEEAESELLLTLEGLAFTYEGIGLFTQRLVRSEYFGEVKIGSCREVLIERQPVTSFELSAPLVKDLKDLAAQEPAAPLPPFPGGMGGEALPPPGVPVFPPPPLPGGEGGTLPPPPVVSPGDAKEI